MLKLEEIKALFAQFENVAAEIEDVELQRSPDFLNVIYRNISQVGDCFVCEVFLYHIKEN